jgi:glycerol-3-phosphate dehydrogenase
MACTNLTSSLQGAWATAAARVAAKNLLKKDSRFVFKPSLKMWVFEELFRDRKLSELINERHENVKYLPGVILPDNILAFPDLEVSFSHILCLSDQRPQSFGRPWVTR